MNLLDVSQFGGTVLIVAPHMDDEVLACGGLIASLTDPTRVRVVYATDGTKSPAPLMPWRDAISDDLGEVRKRESTAAVGVLGVPRENLTFFDLPEADLPQHARTFERLLAEHLDKTQPDHILAPFRYDRHPDHLAVNRAVTRACAEGRIDASLHEYFVYHRWRLLPRRDVRRYIRPDCLIRLDIEPVARRKRQALACFRSQTTQYYPWQTRPILMPELLDEECCNPEIFLRFDPSLAGSAVFTGAVPWIRIAHRLEPQLQKWKYYTKATFVRASRSSSRT